MNYLIFEETNSRGETYFAGICFEELFLTYLAGTIEDTKHGITFAMELLEEYYAKSHY